jgi:hypothetical protein
MENIHKVAMQMLRGQLVRVGFAVGRIRHVRDLPGERYRAVYEARIEVAEGTASDHLSPHDLALVLSAQVGDFNFIRTHWNGRSWTARFIFEGPLEYGEDDPQ